MITLCCRSRIERNFGQQYWFRMDAFWYSLAKFHVCTPHVFPKGAAEQRRKRGNIISYAFKKEKNYFGKFVVNFDFYRIVVVDNW